MSRVVVGVDAGGTGTRAVALTLAGERVGRGESGPANPHALSAHEVATALQRALRYALRDVSPSDVAAGVVGIAGHSAVEDPTVASAIEAAWTSEAPFGPVHVVGDAVVAFAAGTFSPDGAVLIAGTGAVAAEISGHRVARTVDGLGWLLGDEGSGFWLGLAAARHAARALVGQVPGSRLTKAVIQQLDAPDLATLVARCHEQPRHHLAALATLVCDAAVHGDQAAAAIVRRAADHLATTVAELGDHAGPLVLAGGLLTHATPVRKELLELLTARPGRRDIAIANDSATGAAWLAAANALGPAGQPTSAERLSDAAARLHRRIFGASDAPHAGSRSAWPPA